MPLDLWTTYLGTTHLVSFNSNLVNKIKEWTEGIWKSEENNILTSVAVSVSSRVWSTSNIIFKCIPALFYSSPVRGGQSPAEHTAGV